MSNGVEYEERESAFSNRLRSFAIKNLMHKDINGFLNSAFTIFEPKIKETLQEQFVLKVGACFLAKLVRKKEISDDKENENDRNTVENDEHLGENDEHLDENDKHLGEKDHNYYGKNTDTDENQTDKSENISGKLQDLEKKGCESDENDMEVAAYEELAAQNDETFENRDEESEICVDTNESQRKGSENSLETAKKRVNLIKTGGELEEFDDELDEIRVDSNADREPVAHNGELIENREGMPEICTDTDEERYDRDENIPEIPENPEDSDEKDANSSEIDVDMVESQKPVKNGIEPKQNDDQEEIDADKNIDDEEIAKLYIYCEYAMISADTNLIEWYTKNIIDTVKIRVEDFEIKGSGWTLHSIVELEVNTNRYDVLRGAAYMPLPKFLFKKKAIINVANSDEYCFKWAVLAARYPMGKSAQNVNKYRDLTHNLDFSGIDFPVRLNDIQKFENKNPSISINVYMFDEEKKLTYPVRLTKGVKKEHHINLLLLSDVTGETVDGDIIRTTHYCWIKSMSRLLSVQVSKANRKQYFCDRCIQHFTTEELLNRHIPNCIGRNNCRIVMPKKGENLIYFKKYQKKLTVPFIIYADIESILKAPMRNFCNSEKTKAYQEHETYSIGFFLKCHFDDSQSFYKSYRGPDCIEWFVRELHSIARNIAEIMKIIVPINMNEQEEEDFQMAQRCHICEKEINAAETKVRDHCHFTGKFRGAAHQNCNVNYKVSKIIPVVFHNLSGYDSHFIIREVSTQFDGDISIIPVNDQNYISFTKTVDDAIIPTANEKIYESRLKLKFIDSFRFMASSLDKLASYLPSNKKVVLKSQFQGLEKEKFALLERKGVFPYDYVDSWEKLNENELPTKEQFNSKLSESGISESEYRFAQKIWNEFNIKTLGEYSDLYLKTDILLLADVFENFRETCMSIYKLDPAHYYTSPGYSWDAMLKFTNVQIELFTDIDMILFIEKGIRGGISQCSGRYSKANNKYMVDFDPQKPSSYLMYLDVNNLYGDAMMKSLPLNGFQWCDNFDVEHLKSIDNDSPTGYILEVDLEYPEYLHDHHQDYPLCAETRTPPGRKQKKLLLTLFDKKNYVIHHTMLKFVLSQGLILKKIHRVLKFNQSKWLHPYINLNTEQRKRATNDFEKNLYKLMSNAVYGKTMENLRNRVDVKLKTKWHGRYGAAQLIAQPNFKKRKIFDENLVAIEMLKTEILMEKPIVIGMAVLDISKVVMCDFHYNYMKPKYGENVQVLYTDTDSFIYKVFCEDFYADMKSDIMRYDTSDYPENNVYMMPRLNNKIPGLMKDECGGKCMTEFVGLRSKMYSVRVNHHDAIKKAKGIKKYTLDKKICFDDYKRCIEDNCTILRSQNTIRSLNHNVFSVKQTKIALSPFDDKRKILANGIDTLPHGHFSLINQ